MVTKYTMGWDDCTEGHAPRAYRSDHYPDRLLLHGREEADPNWPAAAREEYVKGWEAAEAAARGALGGT